MSLLVGLVRVWGLDGCFRLLLPRRILVECSIDLVVLLRTHSWVWLLLAGRSLAGNTFKNEQNRKRGRRRAGSPEIGEKIKKVFRSGKGEGKQVLFGVVACCS